MRGLRHRRRSPPSLEVAFFESSVPPRHRPRRIAAEAVVQTDAADPHRIAVDELGRTEEPEIGALVAVGEVGVEHLGLEGQIGSPGPLGAKPGDRVVSSGIFKLRNGMSVVENNELSPKSAEKPKPSDS